MSGAMETLAAIYERHKGVDCRSGCDKGTVHSYIETYSEIFSPFRTSAKRVLEIGLMSGNSLRMWEEYFERSQVFGVDLCDTPHNGMADLRPLIAEGNHRVHLFDATSKDQVEEHFADLKFDVIIDDASHYLPHQIAIYENLKSHVAPGGIYVIEDVENFERDGASLLALSDRSKVIDLRAIKNRYDDVLVVIQ